MTSHLAATPRAHLRLGLVVALVVLVLDQLSKEWVLGLMQPPRVIEVTPFFNLVLVRNYGVSFGTFAGDAAWLPYVLSAVAAAIVGALAWWLRQADRWFVALSLGLVIGGAVGNVIDRLRFGAVIDFLDFHLAGWHFWAFNVADSGISIGVTLLVIDGLFATPEKS